MSLKIPQVFSQRDPRWASLLLGYNTNSQFNIGLYGCLITAFGMYLDDQPNNVNQKLKDGGGFEQGGGNFIWSKCSLLGLAQTYISPYYDGLVSVQGLTKIKEFLDQGYPLICEIDFNPATTSEEMHFVLLMGYEDEQVYCADPWTGSIVSLDVYGGPARAILQFRAYNKTLPQDTDTSSVIIERSDAFIAICEKLKKPADKDIVLAEIDSLLSFEEIARQKGQKLDEANKRIEELIKQGEEVQILLTGLRDENQKLTVTVGELEKTTNTTASENERLLRELGELRKANTEPIFTNWKQIVIEFLKRI